MVVVGATPARADAIASHAVAVRRSIAEMLFGFPDCQPWVPACMIHVHRDRASFLGAVGNAPTGVEGATSIEFLGEVVCRRRIDVLDISGTGPPSALAHELVHVVLADRFTNGPPPRWADEGLATLFDSLAKQRGHEADFREAAARGQAWRLAELMSLDKEPADGGRLRVFYGQSAAVVRWLLGRADGPTFLRFVDECEAVGLDVAVRRHYGIESIASFEEAWLRAPAEVQPQDEGESPASPAGRGSAGGRETRPASGRR